MTPADITQLITTVGFPIVCCGALFWKMIQDDKRHTEETKSLTEALNNNTIALTKLSERMDRDYENN